jgi:hypothetical protein
MNDPAQGGGGRFSLPCPPPFEPAQQALAGGAEPVAPR